MTTRRLALSALSICVVAAALASPAAYERLSAQGRPPKLIVILVVDQMRADYLEWYGAHFTSGLKRLITGGAWFTRGAYPYLNTITCAGHSTIGTGTFPYQHGMILNNWLDRKTGKSPYCTDDPEMTEISYNGLAPVQGDSAKRLLKPALGEQVMSRGGRSVALSMKPRSAITLTGHTSTAVIWFDDRGGWTTSSAFTNGPVPFLQSFIDANPITADYDKVWKRSLPAESYQGEDTVKSEGTYTGWTQSFPHPLGLANGKADAPFYGRWQRSPFADEYLGRMAMTAIDALKLGRGSATDYLAVSFSAVDGVGHVYGPRSHEIQDTLFRLDKTIGRLLAHLDATVGAGNYVLGLSADHGVAEIPEQKGTGRVGNKSIIEALQKVLVPALGEGTHVLSAAYTDIYLSDAACERLAKDIALRNAAFDALRAVPGVKYTFWGPDLQSAEARASTDPVRRAAALSHYPGRSGDIIVAPAENWIMSTSTTTHGTQYSYDQRVPVILFGSAIRAGHYSSEATPADLVPTLTSVARVKISPTDGRVLKEALK